MNLNNNKNCSFVEDAAAYLYGEIENRDKVSFETHLAKCDSCAEEIAGFTSLREGIADWKMKSFDVLATPVIEIPFEKDAPTIEIQTEKVSWFDSLKNALTFSPAMATIAAAIVLALFAGVGFLILNSNSQEVASNTIDKLKVAPPPTIKEKTSETESKSVSDELPAPDVAKNENNLPEIAPKNDIESAPEITETKVSEKPQPTKIASETPKKIRTVEPKRKSVVVKTIEETSPVQAQKMPKLNTLPDNEEVDELSLSDLLADVDAK